MKVKNKTTKKAAKNFVVPFNKKNVLALADAIYTDRGGVVVLRKLCDGTLRNGKDGGRTLHCAVGEAYFTFVNNDLKKVLSVKGEKNEYGDMEDYASKYGGQEGPTGATIDALVEAAQLKQATPANQRKLAAALENAVSSNDDADGSGAGGFAERSEAVAEIFRKQIAPLLK